MKQVWSQEEVQFLRDNCGSMSASRIAECLGRSMAAVAAKRSALGLTCSRPAWTPEEEELLQELWGKTSVAGICKKLGRSHNAVMIRVNRMGLPPYLECGEYITINQLHNVLYGTNFNTYQKKSWINDRGCPVHNKRVGKATYQVVCLDEFWEWAEKNRSFLDFSKMEPLALGEEPDWVADQRRKDYHAFAVQRKDPWTADEDARLKMLLKQHKYGYAELSDMLRRSAGAIQRRCQDLGLKERPVKADNHGKEAAWTDEDYSILADGIRNGDSYTLIGNAIGKSEKAIRGKVYFVYLTENADKVRAMMGNNPWGYGAPVPTVRQAVHLSRTRTETKATLEQLAGVLYHRTLELKKEDYDHYFQRAMCMNWDDLRSRCSAGYTDCDSCIDFIRIKPQYCARCGGTFYERTENRFCAPCRTARKKKAQRHWCRVNGRTSK